MQTLKQNTGGQQKRKKKKKQIITIKTYIFVYRIRTHAWKATPHQNDCS